MSADAAFRGFVETTLDALLIFEGCRRGLLPKITRRLQEFEKRALVVSGAVFVFDEEETGIKRWTDGLSWSPSRTLGNFLVYRELDKKAGASGAGEEGAGGGDGLDDLPSGDAVAGPSSGRSQPASSARRRSLSDTTGATPPLDRARERALVGSLTSTYRFRSDGLVKKTISLAGLHMIGYYRIDDVTSGRLRTPSSHVELMSLEVSSDFLSPTHFRVPPIVEMASDGHLTYKGEADTPMSPLTRSGSSQGFPTPALGSSRSRPPSSDSSSLIRPISPRIPPLPIASTSQREAPNSPHRGSTSTFRSFNRYDPYSAPRASPNLNTYPQSAGYPFPEAQRPPSPRSGSTFPSLAGSEELYRGTEGSTGLSPSLGMLSSSAPTDQPWGRPMQLNRQTSDTTVPSFYQPRHATPFAPSEHPLAPNASAAGIFAYQPPPQPPSRGGNSSHGTEGHGSPPAAYQNYNNPLPASQAMSPFGPAPTSRVHYPSSSSNLPHQPHQSQHSQSVPPHSIAPHQHGLSSSSTTTSSHPSPFLRGYPPPRPSSAQQGNTYDYISPSLPPPSTQHSHQQQQHTYPAYAVAPPPAPHSPLENGYGYAPDARYTDPRQPTGMVMPLGSGDLDEEGRHGLGLIGSGQHQSLGGSSGARGRSGYGGAGVQEEERFAPRSVKAEPQDPPPPHWWNAAPQQHHQQQQGPPQHQHHQHQQQQHHLGQPSPAAWAGKEEY